MKTTTIAALSAILALSGLSACSPPPGQAAAATAPQSEQSSQPTQAQAAPVPVSTNITMAQFSQLRSGMRYAKVVAILGRPGEELSSSDLAGIHTVMYSWKNDDLGNMNAMFQNDHLIQKAQFGLK